MYVTIVVSKRFLKKKIRRETQKMLCVKRIYYVALNLVRHGQKKQIVMLR